MKPHGALEHASVKQYCKALRMPVIGANFVPWRTAVKERRNHIGYLEALLAMEAKNATGMPCRHAFTMPSAAHEDAGRVDFNQARTSPLPRSASWPREATSNAPNRWF